MVTLPRATLRYFPHFALTYVIYGHVYPVRKKSRHINRYLCYNITNPIYTCVCISRRYMHLAQFNSVSLCEYIVFNQNHFKITWKSYLFLNLGSLLLIATLAITSFDCDLLIKFPVLMRCQLRPKAMFYDPPVWISLDEMILRWYTTSIKYPDTYIYLTWLHFKGASKFRKYPHISRAFGVLCKCWGQY